MRSRSILFFCSVVLLLACEARKGKQADDDSIIFSPNKEVVCFVYHRFGDDRYPSTNITLPEFRSHLEYLTANNFTIQTLGEALKYLQKPGPSGQEKVVAITIDDGYRSFYEGGFPLLKEYGVSATLFVNTSTVGGDDYMDYDQLKQLVAYGIEIGNHSDSHSHFLNMPMAARRAEFRKDLHTCDQLIEKNLHVSCNLYAYPYGEYDSIMMETLKEEGYLAAAAQHSGVVSSSSDVYAIPRFPMAGALTGIDGFREKANMHALRVKWKEPQASLIPDGQDAPYLQVALDRSHLYDLDNIKAYCQNIECSLTVKSKQDTLVEVRAPQFPSQRRTLFTITVPGIDHQGWYWFSHLWINPDMAE